jgi:hypothetical protein
VSTSFSHRTTFDADIDLVWQMLGDPEFLKQKAASGGHAEVVVRNDQRTVTVSRVVTAELPTAARSLLGESVVLTETQRWAQQATDGSYTADLDVTVPGAPLTVSGQLELRPLPKGCTLEINVDISVRLAFIASMAEGLIRDQLAAAVTREEAVGAAWLAQR